MAVFFGVLFLNTGDFGRVYFFFSKIDQNIDNSRGRYSEMIMMLTSAHSLL